MRCFNSICKSNHLFFKMDKNAIFEKALIENHTDLVDDYLSNKLFDFKIHKFVTPKRLRNLFKRAIDEEFFKTVCWEGILGHAHSRLDKDSFIDYELNFLIEEFTGLSDFISTDVLFLYVIEQYPSDAASAQRKSLAILSMYAVMTFRRRLAIVLWKHCDQPIHLGLILSIMYERLSVYTFDENQKDDLAKQAVIFSEYATGVLDDCYARSAQRAIDVLNSKTSDWKMQTAISLAANSRLTTFMAHICCQRWLTNLFNGNIRIREVSWGVFPIPTSIKIVLCGLFILPLYIWVRFKENVSLNIYESLIDDVDQIRLKESEDIDMSYSQNYPSISSLAQPKKDFKTRIRKYFKIIGVK